MPVRLRHKSGRQHFVDPASGNGENQPQYLDCVSTYYHNVAPKYPYYPAIGPSLFFSLVNLATCPPPESDRPSTEKVDTNVKNAGYREGPISVLGTGFGTRCF